MPFSKFLLTAVYLTPYLSTIHDTMWQLRKVELSEAELAKVAQDVVELQFTTSPSWTLCTSPKCLCELNQPIKAGDIFEFRETLNCSHPHNWETGS